MVQFMKYGMIKMIFTKEKWDEYAKKFYEAVRKCDVNNEVYTISKNTNFSEEDVRKIYNHIFIN